MLGRRSRLGCNSMDEDINDFDSRRHRAAPAPRRSATRRSRQGRAGESKRPSTRSLIRLLKTLFPHPTRRRPLSPPKRSLRAIPKLSRIPGRRINGRLPCSSFPQGLPPRAVAAEIVGSSGEVVSLGAASIAWIHISRSTVLLGTTCPTAALPAVEVLSMITPHAIRSPALPAGQSPHRPCWRGSPARCRRPGRRNSACLSPA